MRKATVSTPFIFKRGHKCVLIHYGSQQLTEQQYQYALAHGFLAKEKPKTKAVQAADEVTSDD